MYFIYISNIFYIIFQAWYFKWKKIHYVRFFISTIINISTYQYFNYQHPRTLVTQLPVLLAVMSASGQSSECQHFTVGQCDPSQAGLGTILWNCLNPDPASIPGFISDEETQIRYEFQKCYLKQKYFYNIQYWEAFF